MAQEHFVIIGNGPAGNQAAITLREKVSEARITMIDRESVRCYKPNLLPDYVAGRVSEDKLYVSPLDFYKSKGIKLRLGQKVVDVNFAKKEITLDHKEVIRFSGLILTVGGKPRIPEDVGLQALIFLASSSALSCRSTRSKRICFCSPDKAIIISSERSTDSGNPSFFSISRVIGLNSVILPS